VEILIAFHLLFFWPLYTRSYQMATSELLSTFFPTWLKGERYDRNYWLNLHSHPVLSFYYPIQRGLHYLAKRLTLDGAFRILVCNLLFHHLLGSMGWFLLLRSAFPTPLAIFGALTLTYSAFPLKQQPSIVYTHAWFPWMLVGLTSGNIPLASIAIGMLFLAGYYPLLIYLLPVGIALSPHWTSVVSYGFGGLIGLIQIIPFLRYLPKTIRKPYGEGHLGSWERKFYFGVTPLAILFLTFKPLYLTILLPIVASYALRKWLPRGYQRAWILSVYLAVYFALCAMQSLDQRALILLVILQATDLWLHNRGLLPPRPFCELPQRPSQAFNTPLTRYLREHLNSDARVSGLPFPLFTGHINSFKTLGYCGSMQLRLMAKWRGDTDPNGSGHHDYFMGKEDGHGLDIARVQFAFSYKKLNWPSTPIKHLYLNPRYRSA